MSERPRVIPPLTELRSPESFAAVEPLRRQTHLGNFLTAVDRLATDFTLANPHLLPQGITKDQASAVLTEKDYPEPEETKSYNASLTLTRQRERISRRLIKKTVEGENQLGLSPTETVVLLGSCELGEHFDELSMQWREKLQQEPEGTKELVEQVENKYLYVVGETSETNEVSLIPYAQAFKKPIEAIGQTIETMVDKLREIPEDADTGEREALIDYYSALSSALTTTDPEEHEDKFKEVDKLGMQIQGRMQPIHMIEVVGDPLDRRVAPDYALAFREETPLNDQMDAIKGPLVDAINSTISHSDYLNANSPGGVYTTAVASGMRLDFNPAGQFPPNRLLPEGIKIFINDKAIARSRPLQNRFFQSVFGEQSTIDDNELNPARALFVSGHERVHRAFMESDTPKKLGEHFEQLEEVKADITTLAAMPDFLPDEQQQDAMIVSLLSASLFYLKKASATAASDYYNSGLTIARTMIDAEIIKQEGKNFTVDLSPAKKAELFVKAKDVAGELAAVYNAEPDQAKEVAGAFRSKYCHEPVDEEPLFAIAHKLKQAA